MRNLKLAAIQTSPVAGDIDATLARFEIQLRSLVEMKPGLDLVVAPELLLGAPKAMLEPDPDFNERAATTIPGPVTDRLGVLAQELGIWLVPGSLVERHDGHLYNTAIAIDPTGSIVARYRKIFPWRPYETLDAGSTFTTFDIEGIGRIGLAICYDGSFPEVARQLAWMGAEVIIQPTLTTTRDREMELVMARANAFTNQVFIVNLNGSAPCGVGESVLVDPEGTIMQRAGATDEVLFGVLDLDHVARVREHGTHGINRPWEELAGHCGGLEFPMYGGARMLPPRFRGEG
ncbi:carbon-nitrogen hydrolase family protein [Zhihengliuella halotolerans]|uniref:Formamidase n=1 Tax=Zhihengliuella halotolerans TaxID=370736 RepID=A0A4Q8AGN1_9MICC|nr:carbon-nitrogen hydrolase family protein [Zhihengliuella halotolerans]RZU63011.1 formamidase [Zhihengliuella halotolerans]